MNELARTDSQDRAVQGAQPEIPPLASSSEGHAIAAKAADFEREPGYSPNASEPEDTGKLAQAAMDAIEVGDIGQARALLGRAEAAAESITGLEDQATTISLGAPIGGGARMLGRLPRQPASHRPSRAGRPRRRQRPDPTHAA